jgi:hypothetical protein
VKAAFEQIKWWLEGKVSLMRHRLSGMIENVGLITLFSCDDNSLLSDK